MMYKWRILPLIACCLLTTASRTIAQPVLPGPANNNKHKISIKLSPDTTVSDAATYFKSKYIKTDPKTGYVNIELPDVKKYHYAIRFYDQVDKMVLEIPGYNLHLFCWINAIFRKKECTVSS